MTPHIELVLQQHAAAPDGSKVMLDARHTKWSSPYGLIALLTLAQARGDRPQFYPPEDANTASYWARAGFFRQADKLFEFTRPGAEVALRRLEFLSRDHADRTERRCAARGAAHSGTFEGDHGDARFSGQWLGWIFGSAIGELSEHRRTRRWPGLGRRCRRTTGRSDLADAWL